MRRQRVPLQLWVVAEGSWEPNPSGKITEQCLWLLRYFWLNWYHFVLRDFVMKGKSFKDTREAACSSPWSLRSVDESRCIPCWERLCCDGVQNFCFVFVISVLSTATVTFPATERYRNPASVEVFFWGTVPFDFYHDPYFLFLNAIYRLCQC